MPNFRDFVPGAFRPPAIGVRGETVIPAAENTQPDSEWRRNLSGLAPYLGVLHIGIRGGAPFGEMLFRATNPARSYNRAFLGLEFSR